MIGETVCLNVFADDTIDNVKGQIQHKQGTKPFLQMLTHNGKQVFGSDSLIYLDIVKNSELV